MHTHTQTLPVLGLPFNTGFQHYADLSALVGEHRAQLALSHCVHACNRFDQGVLLKADAISKSAYINPNDLAGVDVLVLGMMVEVLKTMHQFKCFPLDDVQLPWEFYEIKTCKLFICPPSIRVAMAHDLLAHQLQGHALPTPSF